MQCTAKSKRSGEQCRNHAVKGKTKCRIHGGANDGPPKGNKNALKHGAYEAISPETMTEEEIAYANAVTLIRAKPSASSSRRSASRKRASPNA